MLLNFCFSDKVQGKVIIVRPPKPKSITHEVSYKKDTSKSKNTRRQRRISKWLFQKQHRSIREISSRDVCKGSFYQGHRAVSVFPKSLRIKCWYHRMKNFHDKVPPDLWPEIKAYKDKH